MPRILYIHQAYPAQFEYMTRVMLADRRHEVTAIIPSKRAGGFDDALPGVRYEFYAPLRERGGFRGKMQLGSVVAHVAERLARAEGYRPDLIIGHPGWGEMAFLNRVTGWESVPQLHYVEWHYGAPNTDFDFSDGGRWPPKSLDQKMAAHTQNGAMLMGLSDMAAGITPTGYQQSVIPPFARAKTLVQFDGTDTDFFSPDASATLRLPNGRVVRAGDEVITFMNRNFEPHRGIHRFVEALELVFRARPRALVAMIGLDRKETKYGAARTDGKGWLTYLKENHSSLDWSRVHELGKVPRRRIRQLLRVSKVHVYLTVPFFLSWSSLEAMSAGCLLLGSSTPPVLEMVKHGHNGLLVPFHDSAALGAKLIELLAQPAAAHAALRANARALVVDRYDAKTLYPARVQFAEAFLDSSDARCCLDARPNICASSAAHATAGAVCARRARRRRRRRSPRPPPPTRRTRRRSSTRASTGASRTCTAAGGGATTSAARSRRRHRRRPTAERALRLRVRRRVRPVTRARRLHTVYFLRSRVREQTE